MPRETLVDKLLICLPSREGSTGTDFAIQCYLRTSKASFQAELAQKIRTSIEESRLSLSTKI